MAGPASCGTAMVPHRTIQTGIGPVEVRRAKVRDRGRGEHRGENPLHVGDPAAMGPPDARASMRCCRFSTCAASRPATSRRRSPPCSGQGRAEPVAGRDHPAEGGAGRRSYERWQKRDLSARRYVYVWADGVYLQARMEPTSRVHARDDRRHTRGQEGAGRLPGGRPGERAESGASSSST